MTRPLNSSKASLMWLMIGIFALGISGVLSLILVLARVPFFSSFLSHILPFKIVLVIHVNLSVLVWLLAVTASIWSLFIHKALEFYNVMLCYLAYLGIILISISPFFAGEAISNNYIPILQNLPFILGLACFITAMLITCLIAFFCYIFNYFAFDDEYNIISTSSFIFIITSLCFVMSYISLNDLRNIQALDIYYFYELLFWGAGHLLQFLYTQILGFVWLILAYNIFNPLTLSNKNLFKKLYKIYFFLNIIFVLPSILIYFLTHIDDAIYIEFFTYQMKYLGGIMPMLFVLTLGVEYLIQRFYLNSFPPLSIRADIDFNATYVSSLISSIVLFIFGGIIGFIISGANVIIPAHYHGCIVGISLAFMGYSYFYLNQVYIITDKMKRQSTLQPIIYGTGQLLHISGLAIAGGYGALRKTPGVELSLKAKFGMGIMGIGGVVAIIGGLMFVIICVNSLLSEKINNKVSELVNLS